MRSPIPEIFEAARLLDRAVDAHLACDYGTAATLIGAGNLSPIRAWTESLWGSAKNNPDQWSYHRCRKVTNAPPILPKDRRIPVRMPSPSEQAALIDRYERHCVFCGIPLIRKQIRIRLAVEYPSLPIWGKTNLTQHAALQCMWLQFDHVLPHSRGGDNFLNNMIVTCAGCNYGRMERTLDELGLMDPRVAPIKKTLWNGLEKLLQSTRL